MRGIRPVSIDYACLSFVNDIIDLTLGKPESEESIEGGSSLLWALFGFFKGSLILNAIPRLGLIAFRYSQPIIINKTIRYVTKPTTEMEERDITGYHLIIATFIIYIGSGVSCLLVNY
jgi:ATP-binding cassette subfamily C (CFTR/MRP) protein 1